MRSRSWTVGAATPLVKAGKLRALAVLADRRFPLLPATPTMAEAGFAGFDVVAWFGLFAPAGAPPAMVQRFNAELRPILASRRDCATRAPSSGSTSSAARRASFRTTLSRRLGCGSS